MTIEWQMKFAHRMGAMRPSAIRAISRFAKEPGVISFASGSPNPRFFPETEIGRAFQAIFADPARREAALQYGPSEGYPPLRRYIAAQMGCDVENVLVTNGSQQGLTLVGSLLLDAGDKVIVTEPTYVGALQAFNLSEASYVGIPMGDDGLDMDRLERAFQEGAKFAYVTPDFGNPSGHVLPASQRRRLLELSLDHHVPVVEDQAYDQLRLSGDALPSLYSAAPDRVVYAGTFSKSLAPGLRIGWLAAEKPVIERLVMLKQASDLHGSMLAQILVHEVLSSQSADRLTRLRDGYRIQRDAMLDGLQRHMPAGMTWTHPEGGMFVLLTLPETLDAELLLGVAMRDEKVLFVPGAPFFANGGGRNTVRLSYSMAPAEAIEEGVARLARAIRRCLLTNDRETLR